MRGPIEEAFKKGVAAERLAALRAAVEVLHDEQTYGQIARAVGVEGPALSKIVNGDKMPSIETFAMLELAVARRDQARGRPCPVADLDSMVRGGYATALAYAARCPIRPRGPEVGLDVDDLFLLHAVETTPPGGIGVAAGGTPKDLESRAAEWRKKAGERLGHPIRERSGPQIRALCEDHRDLADQFGVGPWSRPAHETVLVLHTLLEAMRRAFPSGSPDLSALSGFLDRPGVAVEVRECLLRNGLAGRWPTGELQAREKVKGVVEAWWPAWSSVVQALPVYWVPEGPKP